jgi:hypothetical protein
VLIGGRDHEGPTSPATLTIGYLVLGDLQRGQRQRRGEAVQGKGRVLLSKVFFEPVIPVKGTRLIKNHNGDLGPPSAEEGPLNKGRQVPTAH